MRLLRQRHPTAAALRIITALAVLALAAPSAAAQEAGQPPAPGAEAEPGAAAAQTLYLPFLQRSEASPPPPDPGPEPQVSQSEAPAAFNGDVRALPLATPSPAVEYGYSAPGPLHPDNVPPAPSAPLGPAPAAPERPAAFSPAYRNFDGISFTGFLPPDTVGDVGPNHYVQMVNSAFAIFDKAGTLLAGPSNINSLWAGVGGLCETTNRGDPIVLYDPLADRWLLSQFAFDRDANNNPVGPFHQCIAISQTPNPVTGGWFLYDFNVHATKFQDYPKFGVWPDAYYMSTNQFGGTGGGGAFAFDRPAMLAGQAAIGVYFDTAERNMLPSDLDGPTAPPAGSPNFFTKFVDGSPDRLEIREFHVDFVTVANSTFGNLASLNVNAFDSELCTDSEFCIPQPGTSKRLATLPDRLMWRLQYRNFGTHATLMANHTVDENGSDHAGIRWYELRRVGAAWSVFQQGTFAPDSEHRWMGSIAMDRDGNIALGYSVASGSLFPGVRYAGRRASDPAGTLPIGEFTLIDGAGSQTRVQQIFDNNGNLVRERGRWGDYSAMSVDPVDDCTFWYTQEYIPASGDWRTRIGAFSICNHPPVAEAGGPYNTPEGVDVALNGLGSSDPDGDALSFAWDLNNNGVFGDAFTATPSFTLVGQDGVFPIALRVTDPSGASATDTSTVTVANVPPSVSFSVSPAEEGAVVTATGQISDPGWLEALTGTIDWGDGTPAEALAGTLENVRPEATLTFTATHVYGDNGAFTVRVCGSDDDTTTCLDKVVLVANVDPAVAIDESGARLINGAPTFLLMVGQDQAFAGRVQDPGSDDLTVSWDWDAEDFIFPNHSRLYLVNPPNPDPLPSPSVQPRDITDGRTTPFAFVCRFIVTQRAVDDDGGLGQDQTYVIAVGRAVYVRNAGYWRNLYQVHTVNPPDGTITSYLQVVGHMSQVFDEARSAATPELALAILSAGGGASPRDRLDRELLAAWLNFASGALGYDEVVDTDGDGVADTDFATVMAAAEAVRLNPAATAAELADQIHILQLVN